MQDLSWNQFDQAVVLLAKRFDQDPISGIYGVPRGGLCLAVALSHALQHPLLSEPRDGALVVDDVYETGQTLRAIHEHVPGARFAVWVSKQPPQWWEAAVVTESSEWLLFPWENAALAHADEKAYLASRRGG